MLQEQHHMQWRPANKERGDHEHHHHGHLAPLLANLLPLELLELGNKQKVNAQYNDDGQQVGADREHQVEDFDFEKGRLDAPPALELVKCQGAVGEDAHLAALVERRIKVVVLAVQKQLRHIRGPDEQPHGAHTPFGHVYVFFTR